MRSRAFSLRSRALLASAALSALLFALPDAARAGDAVPSLDLRGWHAPTDPASGIYIQPADSPATGDWNLGVWLSYAYHPITLRDPRTNDVAFKVLSHQLTSDVTASIGLWHRLELGFDLPVLLYQTGDAPNAAARRALGDFAVPGQALGDLGIDGKLTLVRPTLGAVGGFALAIHERFTVPTGDQSSFLGEGAVTSETRLFAEYRLVAVGIHAALGAKFRGSTESFACVGLSDAQCASRFGHELPFGLGVTFRPQAVGIDPKGHWTLYLEGHGYLPASPIAPFKSTAASSMRLDLAARYAIGDVSLLAGVETALIGGVGDAPFRGVLSVAWAPRFHDADGDKIPDEIDKCRELPEDIDGFQDSDGCPDGDNDDDGIPDKQDKCPNQKEDEDGFQDADGCPDPDNDGDKILDEVDACPNEPGPPNPDPKKNGCPMNDLDGDGVEGAADKCPNEPEDKDGFQDADGCPDPDNDSDGILDKDDACPNEKGVPSNNPKENGCPDPDPDHDTLTGADDKCPDKPENFNGVEDDDGCPEEGAKKKGTPLAIVKEDKNGPTIAIGRALKFSDANELDAKSLITLRAVSAELLAHADWKVTVGVRSSPKGGDAQAEARAAAVVAAIRRFARRDAAAATAAWNDVKGAPRAAEFGLGLVLVTTAQGANDAQKPIKEPPPAKPPAPPKAAAPPKPKKP